VPRAFDVDLQNAGMKGDNQRYAALKASGLSGYRLRNFRHWMNLKIIVPINRPQAKTHTILLDSNRVMVGHPPIRLRVERGREHLYRARANRPWKKAALLPIQRIASQISPATFHKNHRQKHPHKNQVADPIRYAEFPFARSFHKKYSHTWVPYESIENYANIRL
jgi:hypothetical protein